MMALIRQGLQMLVERVERLKKNAKPPDWSTEFYFGLIAAAVFTPALFALTYAATMPERSTIADRFPTWETAIAAVRTDCDRLTGKEVYVTRYPEKVAIEAVCYHENGERIIGYRLQWVDSSDQQIRVHVLRPMLAHPGN